jgi:hypothetical protein
MQAALIALALAAQASAPLNASLAAQGNAAEAWTQAELESVSSQIQSQVEALRGAKFSRPVKVALSGPEGLREYVAAREALTTTPERLARDEAVAKLLGLVEPGFDLRAAELALLEGQVGGYYDPASGTFFLMQSVPRGVARIILAHELTHALDDQLFGLDALLARAGQVTDRELVFRCVAEGSGSNAMNRWVVQHGSTIPPAELQLALELGADALRRAPQVLWKPMMASYLAGESFLLRQRGPNLAMALAKGPDLERAFREPPRSSEQVLHPEKYWDESQRDDPLEVSIDVASLPEGWRVAGEDTLGELVLALVATPVAERAGIDPTNAVAMMAVKYTNRAAEGWGGDRLALLARGADRFLQLVIAWDTPADADEFLAALERSAPKPWGERPRTPEQGFVAGSTPSGWSAERAADAGGRAVVVVRSWSQADAAERPLESLRLAWSLPAPAGGAR